MWNKLIPTKTGRKDAKKQYIRVDREVFNPLIDSRQPE